MTCAIYPGSFDPFTRGHFEIVRKALRVFDNLHIAVLTNSKKSPMFSHGERIAIIERSILEYESINMCEKEILPDRVVVRHFKGLLVEYMKKIDCFISVRGIRPHGDFEHESNLAHVNKDLDERVETVFFLTDPEFSTASSSVVREALSYKAPITRWVFPDTAEFIRQIYIEKQILGKKS